MSSEMLRESVIYFIKERDISISNILKNVDISRSRLYDYLQGHGRVSATTFMNLLLIIGVTPDELWLRVYTEHPELVSESVADRQKIDAIDLNVANIKAIISTLKKNYDAVFLIKLIENIHANLKQDEQQELLCLLAQPIANSLNALEFFAEADYKLFHYLVDYTSYEDVYHVTERMRRHIDRIMKVIENGGTIHERIYSNYGIQYIAYSQVRFLMAAYRKHDLNAIKETTYYLTDLPIHKLDWHRSFMKKIIQIMQLAFSDDEEGAKLLWQKLDYTINFMLPLKEQCAYRSLLTNSYDDMIYQTRCGAISG